MPTQLPLSTKSEISSKKALLGLAILSASGANPSPGLLLGHCTPSAANHSARGCSSVGSSPNPPTRSQQSLRDSGIKSSWSKILTPTLWVGKAGCVAASCAGLPLLLHIQLLSSLTGTHGPGTPYACKNLVLLSCHLSLPVTLGTRALKLLFNGCACPTLSNAAGPASVPP